MVLTESWLTGKDKDIVVTKALTPDGYSLINSHRKTGRGGGIALVHKSSIKATSCNTYKNITSCETFSAKLTSNGKSITLLDIYRPPPNKRSKLTVSEFFKDFSDMLDDCETIQEEVIIVGDFNFHMDDSNDHHSKRLTKLSRNASIRKWADTCWWSYTWPNYFTTTSFCHWHHGEGPFWRSLRSSLSHRSQ